MKVKLTLTDLKTNKRVSHEFVMANKFLDQQVKDVNNSIMGDELFILLQRLYNSIEKK